MRRIHRRRASRPARFAVARVICTLAISMIASWTLQEALAAQESGAVGPAAVQAAGAGPAGDRSAAASDLRDIFAPSFLLHDRAGDGLIDHIAARIIVPAAPTQTELAAAANIAARLGYETVASDLGLLGTDAEDVRAYEFPVIIVGARNGLLARSGAQLSDAWELAPAQGAVQFLPPDDFFRHGAVLVSGYDATGTLAAAGYLAGRYPNIWNPRGNTFSELAERIGRFFTQSEIPDVELSLDRIVVTASVSGVASVRATARVAAEHFEAARLALEPAAASPDTAARDTAAGGGAGAAGAAARNRSRPTELVLTDLHRLDIMLVSADSTTLVRLLPARPWPARAAADYSPAAAPDFTLGELYSIRGLYRDTRQDMVPDRTDAFLSLQGAGSPAALVDLATRIGLETAGIRLPLVRIAGQDDYPQSTGVPIVVGRDHYQVQRLQREELLNALPGPAGTGSLEFVRRGFGGRNGLVLTGADDAGLRAITEYVAQRMPYLWDHGKGRYRLVDVDTEVRRFFQARQAPGQVALALHKIDAMLDRLPAGTVLESVAVELATERTYAGLDSFIRQRLSQRFPDARAEAATYHTGFGEGREIFTQEFEIPWEVDEFRAAFLAEALPRLGPASRGRVEVRVSESPEIRAELEREIRRELAGRGVGENAFEVHVLSAYKQGYSWLYDAILPRLRGQGVAALEIAYHTLKDSEEVRWQQIEANTRWLQELYPVDAVMARELGIPDSVITFEATRAPAPVYTVRALDAEGETILAESFDPKYVVRPFFDLFPEYEQIRVTTGWVTVEADGETLLDRRIRTDLEAFWDLLQTSTYARIIDYVMDVQDGRPSSGNAPYFDEFSVELSLSEPDYRIGIDEEVISSLEAVHEDIYFQTLTLFNLLGSRYGAGNLSYPGRVLPFVQPSAEGQAGHARIRFTGKERGVPELILTYRERGREPVRQRYPLSSISLGAPKLRAITVAAGEDGVRQLLYEVVTADSTDRYEELISRTSESAIDRQFTPITLLADMARQLGELHAAGIALDALSFDRVAGLAFRFTLSDTAASFSRDFSLPRSSSPLSTVRPKLFAAGYRHGGEPLVQWETPIPPAENDSVLARLATFPGVNVYWAGRSFLGRDIFAADFAPAYQARYVSQAKLNALRPTLLLSGRQHGNEVSSTSHMLRLGELLATDSTYAELLKKVNVVLHPMTNPDGAQLAYDMQLATPDFMLHAGYLGALGVDATSGAGDDPIYPESRVRPELRETWLPDIFVDLHGYPSHEWVQYFAGYSAWVRSRTGTQRAWWAPRGWFIPGYTYNEDPRNPKFQQAQMAILDTITASIRALPEVMDMNRRMYGRYAKYGRQDVESFREHFHNDVLVYLALRGREVSGTGVNSPRITYVSVTTEAPDETARGEWLQLNASAGLAHTSALIRYLATGVNEIRRDATEAGEFVNRSAARVKPVVPPDG